MSLPASKGSPGAKPAVPADRHLLHLGQPVPGNEHPGEGGAGLAGVHVATEEPGGDGGGEVGVVEQDVGRLAAELERDPLDALGRQLHDPPAGPGGAGEGDHVDLGVRGDRFTDDRPDPADQIEHAGREPHLVDDVGQDERVDRRHLARLQHDGAAGGQRRGDLEDDLVQRVVPRRDGAHDADRLTDDEGVPDLLLPFEALGGVGGIGERAGGQAHLDGSRQRHRHAHLVRDDLGDLVGAGAERLGDPGQQLAPLLAGGGGPAGEGGGGGLDGLVDVLGRALGNGGEDLFGGRVDDLQGALAGRGDPGPVDVDLVAHEHGCPP